MLCIFFLWCALFLVYMLRCLKPSKNSTATAAAKKPNASHLVPLQQYDLVPATNTTDIRSITLTRKYRHIESRALLPSHTYTIMHLSHMHTHV